MSKSLKTMNFVHWASVERKGGLLLNNINIKSELSLGDFKKAQKTEILLKKKSSQIEFDFFW